VSHWLGELHSFSHQRGQLAVTIVRIGASKKYSDNWTAAFGRKSAKAAPATSTKGKKAMKKTAKKSAKKR
jgi:hypothetical protein